MMPSTGIFFLVVGPSGVGKDSLIDGARQVLSQEQFEFAKRVITKPIELGGEAYESCEPEEFNRRKHAHGFLVTWSAHGYQYGLPNTLVTEQKRGKHIIANGSREIITDLAARVHNLVVLHITADRQTIRKRLLQRARETPKQIEERLVRHTKPLPEGVRVIEVVNETTLEEGIAYFIQAVRMALAGAS